MARTKGSVNKATAELKGAAQKYTTAALKVLDEVMRTSKSDQARVAAATAILDRGHGKPAQAIEHSGQLAIGMEIIERITRGRKRLANAGE